MYKAFIVDDELLVIKSLIASMRWEDYGFEIAGYALSGAEAYEAIDRIKPDLVFTDIRMPGMSGLELIRNLKNAASEAVFVIISGYAEFALAQKAIHYGAFGYCLKPFDDEEIAVYLRKARAFLDSRKPGREADILDLMEDGEASKAELQAALRSKGVDIGPGSEPYRAVVTVGTRKDESNVRRNAIRLRIGYGKTAYLVQEKEAGEVVQRAAAERSIKGIGISDPIVRVDAMKEAIESAEERAFQYFILGREGLVTDKGPEPPAADQPTHWSDAAYGQDRTKLRTLLEQLRPLFASGRLTIKDALSLYNRIVPMTFQSEDPQLEDSVFSYDKLARMFADAQEMLDGLAKGLGPEAGPVQTKNRLIGPIQDYIQEHYREDVTIHDISAKFNLNPNYFSQLFRKEAGTAFTEYLTALRVGQACEWLRQTDLPIAEIAEQVGYEDYFYFSRVFKKTMGKSPRAYRNEG